MKWDDIISVSGKPGLFVIKGQAKSGVLAESLSDGKKTLAPVFQISGLSDIAIFTDNDELRLPEVIKRMYEKDRNGTGIPGKNASKNELTAFFQDIIPDYDADRFFPSHMKKIIGWYAVLKNAGVLNELIEE
jgi:hypothetical protein